MDVLKGWDTERNAEVKAQASLQYHSLLKADEVERTDAVKVLDSMLPCYGPDHEERRQAAAAGLIVLKHLDLVVGKVESIGHVGRQVNIPVTDGLKKNRVFLNLLGTHWGYVKQVLAGKFEILTQNVGPSELWQNLAIVAAEHPSLATDVLEAGETDLGLADLQISLHSSAAWNPDRKDLHSSALLQLLTMGRATTGSTRLRLRQSC